MLDYRLFRHQNFFKKISKKLDFLPKNCKICVKKCLFFKKNSKIFFALNSFFILYFLTAIRKNQKMGSLSSFGVFKTLTSQTQTTHNYFCNSTSLQYIYIGGWFYFSKIRHSYPNAFSQYFIADTVFCYETYRNSAHHS